MTSEPGRRERATIAVLALSGMLSSLQFTLMVPALPDVPAALGVSANDASWVVTITLLAGTVGTPIVTRMADMYGRRRLLLICLALLAAGSALAAVGMTFPTVLVGRALQGFSASIVPIGISLMRDSMSRDRAVGGIALMSGTVGIGSALGLPLSGVLGSVGGLAAIFFFSAGAAALFVPLVWRIVPESPVLERERFDLTGALLLSAGLTALLLAISKGFVWGWTSPPILGCALVFVVAIAAWIPLQLRSPSPIVDLRTSLRRQVLLTNVAALFVTFGMFANHLLTTHEARAPIESGAGLGLPTILGGLTMLPSALAMVGLTPVAARMLRRRGGRETLMLGSAIITLAFVFRLLVHDGVVAVVLGAFLVGIGTAFAFAAMPTLISDAVPRDELAAANGLNSLVRSLSGAVTSSLFAMVIASMPWPGSPEFISGDGLAVAFAVTAAATAVGTAIAFFLPRPPRLAQEAAVLA
ncbi:MFS transporter [Microbacterium sp. CFH 31415]|uniref:MFS transporter n=1 Tax=Microbacterium sp. CFH 31415 TaxID=2921732 RepID=UPI001F14116A|nr:MFS transporter [Microbacterium sp. CFH 31415]MCH6231648.1 MFS transporter [Microbacterium sp. CFH 31415]